MFVENTVEGIVHPFLSPITLGNEARSILLALTLMEEPKSLDETLLPAI